VAVKRAELGAAALGWGMVFVGVWLWLGPAPALVVGGGLLLASATVRTGAAKQ